MFRTLPQMNPSVIGFESTRPSTRVTRPSSTAISRLQTSGQSSGQALATVSVLIREVCPTRGRGEPCVAGRRAICSVPVAACCASQARHAAAMPPLRTVAAVRYVTPLREGGSLPAIVEADDLGTYVLKFRGAGQGVKVLVAELLAGEVGRVLGLPIPDIVFAELDPRLGQSERDPEIQALITGSAGLNLAIDYLPGSFGFERSAGPLPDPELASRIVWFDAFMTNPDRSPRNPNLLVWHRRLWLIDHGATLYFHFAAQDYAARAGNRFPEIRQHILLTYATALRDVDVARSE